MDQWQDLKVSRPKDKQCVIIGNKITGDVGEARMMIFDDGAYCFVCADDATKVASPMPTHWMPLPDPPR